MPWCFQKLGIEGRDTVLDRCMGSETTGVARVRAGLNSIGIEIEYFKAAKARIYAERAGKGKAR